MVDEKIITSIQEIVDEADRMRNAYFFTPPGKYEERCAYGARHSHDTVCWEEGGHSYTATYYVKCSRHNVYAHGYYTRDGKVTTLRAVKNSLRRLRASQAPSA